MKKVFFYLLIIFPVIFSYIKCSKQQHHSKEKETEITNNLESKANTGNIFYIGVEEINYSPLYSIEKGKYVGYVRELLDKFAESKGYTFNYKPLPLKRLNWDLVTGHVDLKFPDNPAWRSSKKKGKNIVYSDAVLDYIDGVMVLPGNKGKDLSELKSIGFLLGFKSMNYLDMEKKGKIKTYENPSFNGLIKQGLKGRLGGIYCNIEVIKYRLKNEFSRKEKLVFDPGLPFTKSHYYMSTQKHPEIIKEFNEFLKKETNYIKELKIKYNIFIK